MTEEEIRSCLLTIGDRWAEELDEPTRNKIVVDVSGVLDPYIGESAEEIDAYRYVDEHVYNDIDLAFWLFEKRDPEFIQLLERHGPGPVFYMIGAWSANTAGIESLVKWNGVMAHFLLVEVQGAHKIGREMFDELRAGEIARQEWNANARNASVAARAEQKQARIDYYREMASNIRRVNPKWDRDSVAHEIIKQCAKLQQPVQSHSTVVKALKGWWTS